MLPRHAIFVQVPIFSISLSVPNRVHLQHLPKMRNVIVNKFLEILDELFLSKTVHMAVHPAPLSRPVNPVIKDIQFQTLSALSL